MKITKQSASILDTTVSHDRIRSITSVTSSKELQAIPYLSYSKDGNVCANAGTDREAYCTYSLGPALYPEEFPVDLHFCAYCADEN